MNERIKELAEQAGCKAFVDEYAPFKQEFEKFAELIVRECAKLLDEDSYLMPELGGYAHDMRKMFGVEE
jgi:hypothetical protein